MPKSTRAVSDLNKVKTFKSTLTQVTSSPITTKTK
jgi:hypothetical protein